jgi:hypothetical protein
MQLKINQYDTVETGTYNGKWQIKVGYINKNGEFKPYFKSVTNKDGSTRSVPVSLTFDSDTDKFAFVDMCADEMGYKLVEKTQQPPQEDVPF